MNPLTIALGIIGLLISILLIDVITNHKHIQDLQKENLILDNELKTIQLKKEKGE